MSTSISHGKKSKQIPPGLFSLPPALLDPGLHLHLPRRAPAGPPRSAFDTPPFRRLESLDRRCVTRR